MLDDDFKMLSRSAIAVQPKEPFYEWLKQTDPSMPITDDMKEGTIYLVPCYETGQIESWLKKNFGELFEEQLFLWWQDEAMWPSKRTFKLFNEWFGYSVYPVVFDTQKGFIEKM